MKSSKKRRFYILSLLFLFLFGLCFLGYSIFDRGRPAPVAHKEEMFDGHVRYFRRVEYLPHMMVAHVMIIDLKESGAKLLVTPPDFDKGHPLAARTTSTYLQDFGLQIAVNGDGFTPWWSRSPLDYYPHPGDPVTPNGFAASRGKRYADGLEYDISDEPTLFISRSNYPSFRQPSNIFSAISGDRWLVLGGEPVPDLDNSTLEPRTAVGINKNGRFLYLVVVDGRQPFYSEGATLAELAQILIRHGAHMAMNLDGGGSSTMVVQGEDGLPLVLNSPVDHYIPGLERAVGNHLGVSIK